MAKKKLLGKLKTVYLPGIFTLTSGRQSDFYINAKKLMFEAEALTLMGYVLHRIIKDKWGYAPDAVGGIELGSVPLSSAIALRSQKVDEKPYNHFVIRKNIRTHGTGVNIEGIDNVALKSVVIVDDVLSTGGSLLKAYDMLVSAGATVLGAVVIVDRQEKDLQVLPFPVYAAFTKKQIMNGGK